MQPALVEMARSGDEEAFASLARAAGDRLLAIAYRILRDVGMAEDAVQHTILTAWLELPSLRDPDRFDAWLHRLLVNACYAEIRRGRRWNGNVRLLALETAASPDELVSVVDREQLERGFRRLPPEQRAVFVLHYHVGLTLPEIADQLDIPLGTAKSRLRYAVATLRAALEADARTSLASMERLA